MLKLHASENKESASDFQMTSVDITNPNEPKNNNSFDFTHHDRTNRADYRSTNKHKLLNIILVIVIVILLIVVLILPTQKQEILQVINIPQKQKQEVFQQKVDSSQINQQKILQDPPASKLQRFFVPDFECKAEYITGLKKDGHKFIQNSKIRISKAAYPQLILVSQVGQELPKNHYQSMTKYLQSHQNKSTIYVHSAGLYPLLLIAASSSERTSIILSHEYPKKKLARILFVLNNIKDKLIIGKQSDLKSDLQNSDLLVVSQDYLEQYPTKETLILVDYRLKNRYPSSTFKISSSEVCGTPTQQPYQKSILQPGVYISFS